MKEHRYAVTLTHLETADGEKPERASLKLEVGNHDDIFRIMDLTEKAGILPPEEARAFVLGLKLFADVAMKHRDEPLFAGMKPQLTEIIHSLKTEIKTRTPQP